MVEGHGVTLSVETKAALAQAVLENEVFIQAVASMEASAISRAVHAGEREDELRRALLAEVRALRELREKLTFLSKGTANFTQGGSFA